MVIIKAAKEQANRMLTQAASHNTLPTDEGSDKQSARKIIADIVRAAEAYTSSQQNTSGIIEPAIIDSLEKAIKSARGYLNI